MQTQSHLHDVPEMAGPHTHRWKQSHGCPGSAQGSQREESFCASTDGDFHTHRTGQDTQPQSHPAGWNPTGPWAAQVHCSWRNRVRAAPAFSGPGRSQLAESAFLLGTAGPEPTSGRQSSGTAAPGLGPQLAGRPGGPGRGCGLPQRTQLVCGRARPTPSMSPHGSTRSW